MELNGGFSGKPCLILDMKLKRDEKSFLAQPIRNHALCKFTTWGSMKDRTPSHVNVLPFLTHLLHFVT